MKRIICFLTIIPLLLQLFIFSSCGDETVTPVTNNADSCGSSVDSNRFIDVFGLTRLPNNYMQGTNRVYNFYSHFDSICTDQHSVAAYTVTFVQGANIRCYGAVEWSILYQNIDSGSYVITPAGTKWEGGNSVGFKTPFGEFAADCYVNVYLRFPTLGSAQADSVYLVQNVHTVSYRFTYKLHKPSSSQTGNMISNKNYNDLIYVFTNKNNYPGDITDKLVFTENKNIILNKVTGNKLF
jgi:hypothetical protein